MAVRFPLEKFLLFSAALVLVLFVECSQAKPREFKRTNKSLETLETANGKGATGVLLKPEKGIHDRAREFQCITSGIKSIIGNITQSLTSILGGVKNSTSGLGDLTSLFKKPGGFNLTSIFSKPAGCDNLDPLLIANVPGIFFWTPIVILAISILVGVVAAIAIAIGGLGSHITEAIYEAMKEKMNPGGYEDSSGYGMPSSSYGSTGSSYSRLETVDQLTDNFYQANDKYSALSHQPQENQYQKEQKKPQNQQQKFQNYHENQSQYDKWNQIARAKNG